MSVLLKTKTEPKQSGQNSPLRVCFVCTGNTCRSPMAAAVLNALSRESLIAVPEEFRALASVRYLATSAGIFANEGEPIAQNAVKALEAANIRLSGECDYHDHTAHRLTEREAEGFDWLVGLSTTHQMQLLLQFPKLTKKIIGMPKPISDPYGGDEECYRKCLEEITSGVKELFFENALEKKS